MRAILFKLSNHQKEDSEYSKMMISQQDSASQRSQMHKIVLLSLRKPARKMGKQNIKQLFQNQKKTNTSFINQFRNYKTEPNENQNEIQSLSIFKLNFRNLISKSTPSVTGQQKSKITIKKRIPMDLKTSKQAYSTHKEQKQKIYEKNSHKQGIIAGSGQKQGFNNNEELKSRKNKVTFYINNFMKRKYSKTRKVSLGSEQDKSRIRQVNIQKQEFFPWEKSFDSEEDGLILS